MFQPTPAQTDSPAVPTENSTPSMDTTDPPAAPTEDSTSPVETADGSSSDTLSLATFTEFPEGNYLADPKFDTDEFLPDYDADISFLQLGSLNRTYLCVSDNSIYFADRTKAGDMRNTPQFLYFTDIASGITLPLCNRPECSHTDSNCNAYLCNSTLHLLCIYDGKIYWLGEEQVETESGAIAIYANLMRMNLDGTGHETVLSLDDNIRRNLFYNCSGPIVTIHRGYLYIGSSYNDAAFPIEPHTAAVYAISLDSGEYFQIMSESRNCSGSIFSFKPVGNDLYISINSYRRIDTETSDDTGVFYRWNSKTRKGEFLYGEQAVDGTCQTYFGNTMPFPVLGDGLYYSLYEYSENESINKLMKLSFQTGSLEQIGVFPSEALAPCLVKDYIICRSFNNIYLFDYNLNLIFQSESIDLSGLSNFLGANTQYAFYCYQKDDVNCKVAIPLYDGDILFLQGSPT